MSKIQDMEEELHRLKWAEHQKKFQAKLQAEEEFRKAHNIDVYTSDDYCGLTSGKYTFYYGYEVTKNGQWCFTADVDGKEVMRLKTSELWPENDEEPFWYLVAGIGQFLASAGAQTEVNTRKE